MDSHRGTRLGDNQHLLRFQSGLRKLTRDGAENSAGNGEVIDFLSDSQSETDTVLIGDFLGVVAESWWRVWKLEKVFGAVRRDCPSCVTQTTSARCANSVTAFQ